MTRWIITSSLLLTSCLVVQAQENAAPAPRVVKSDPLEMKSVTGTAVAVTEVMPAAKVEVSGGPDVAPAPPGCQELNGQPRLDCMSREVLQAIRTRMTPSDAGTGPHDHPVIVTFVINQFGDMKDIRVEHTSGSDLPKKVIVALYALPKFIPATKAGASIGTSVKITYPFAALFPDADGTGR